jgi:hypothetical protein
MWLFATGAGVKGVVGNEDAALSTPQKHAQHARTTKVFLFYLSQ